MSTNKHAVIRYRALDCCFSNWVEDLVKACNKAIYEYTAIAEGVRK